MSEAESHLIGKMILSAPQLVTQEGGNPGGNGGLSIIQNNGPDGGQEVGHVHFDVMAGRRPWKRARTKKADKIPESIASMTIAPDIAVSKGSTWGTFGRGQLAASGAPGKVGVQRWKDAGATAVVTLQRSDELPAISGGNTIEHMCKELGLTWLHLPLNGRKALSEPTHDDDDSISRISEIVELIKQGEHVVVHCSAGMHRTGFVCYMAMRLLGQSPVETLKHLELMRPVTHSEVIRCKEGAKSIQNAAEERLQSHTI